MSLSRIKFYTSIVESSLTIVSSFFLYLGCYMDSFSDAEIGAAPADIACHGFVNIIVRWIWVFPKENGR